jgi:hypothetical protein
MEQMIRWISLTTVLFLAINVSPKPLRQSKSLQKQSRQVVAIPIRDSEEGKTILDHLESFGLKANRTSEISGTKEKPGYGAYLFELSSDVKGKWTDFLVEKGIKIEVPGIESNPDVKEIQVAVAVKNSAENETVRRLVSFGFTATRTSSADGYSGYVLSIPRDDKNNSIKILELFSAEGTHGVGLEWHSRDPRAFCSKYCAQVSDDFYVQKDEMSLSGGNRIIEAADQFLKDYFGSKKGPPPARISQLDKDRDQVILEVDKLRREVIKSVRYWEKLRLQVIAARTEEGVHIFVNADGWYATAGGSGEISSEDYHDMEKDYLNEFKSYVDHLKASLRDELTRK